MVIKLGDVAPGSAYSLSHSVPSLVQSKRVILARRALDIACQEKQGEEGAVVFCTPATAFTRR